tara:strand:+ start:2730 stop:3116 length:387 start_codon:yes stop_codon:yes gene_type:complete
MSNLNTLVEGWVRDIVAESMREYLEVQSRDANRIAALECKVLEKFSATSSGSDVLHRLDTIDTTMDNITDTLDTLESELYDTTRRVDDVESSYSDIDADKVSCDDLHSVVMDVLNEVQLTVTASPIVR